MENSELTQPMRKTKASALDHFFGVEFLRSLPADNLEASVALAGAFRGFIEATDGSSIEDLQDSHVRLLGLFESFCKQRSLHFPTIGVEQSPRENLKHINEAIWTFVKWAETNHNKRNALTVLESSQAQYGAIFRSEPVYEFSETQLNRAQQLINELRSEIAESKMLTPEHRRRLLKRLEAMQSELHKGTSDIGAVWSFIGEAGLVSRKFGEDLKPITDRAMELGKIIIGVLMAKEGIKALPEITKLLGM